MVCCVQDQYEKAMAALQQRTEELETKLKGVQMVLQEKVQQLKEQVGLQSGSQFRSRGLTDPELVLVCIFCKEDLSVAAYNDILGLIQDYTAPSSRIQWWKVSEYITQVKYSFKVPEYFHFMLLRDTFTLLHFREILLL